MTSLALCRSSVGRRIRLRRLVFLPLSPSLPFSTPAIWSSSVMLLVLGLGCCCMCSSFFSRGGMDIHAGATLASTKAGHSA
jgi:hypothetical protein